ncbi:hypothetical protein LUZ60_000652 [Juncus effusus]|nr:hypothetical protein LUZ60_000652 [Juncus effusus]
MASKSTPLHIVFFPFLAPGHLLPLAHVARLFALHGTKCTILTTPINEIAIRPIVDQTNKTISVTKSSHHLIPITISLIPFPSLEVGLPVGSESAAQITSFEMQEKFIEGLFLLEKPFKQAMENICPDVIVSDSFFPWSVDVAVRLGIPRLVFKGEGLLARCTGEMFLRCVNSLRTDVDIVDIPGLPHRMTFLRMQMMDHHDKLVFALLRGNNDADERSYGEIINSFFDLESDYVVHWQTVIGRRAWLLGPVTLFYDELVKKTFIKEDISISSHEKEFIDWLDGKHSRSVLYVSFGTLSQLSMAQLREIALGIEASDKSFIMVAKDDFLPKELEEMTKGGKIGMVIRGWAPQTLILNHEAVGGFVTHCGWNSTIEAVAAGVPMITWPLFSDQFYNEKLIVEVLRVGVAVGVKDYGPNLGLKQLVQAETISSVVKRAMGDDEEGEGIRQRMKGLKEKAKKAVQEGGSSYIDLEKLIEELMCKRNGR